MVMSFERYTQSTKYNCTTAEGGSQGQNKEPGMSNSGNYKKGEKENVEMLHRSLAEIFQLSEYYRT